MKHPGLQSGSEGDFELRQADLGMPEATRESGRDEKVGNTRWYTRLAAVAAMLAAAGCGPDGTYAGESSSPPADKGGESAENISQQPQIQLKLAGGRNAAISLFFGQNKTYDFVLTSADNPQDTFSVLTKGKKVEELEGSFRNQTDGYGIEAFDQNGAPVPINLTGQPGTIYGPERF